MSKYIAAIAAVCVLSSGIAEAVTPVLAQLRQATFTSNERSLRAVPSNIQAFTPSPRQPTPYHDEPITGEPTTEQTKGAVSSNIHGNMNGHPTYFHGRRLIPHYLAGLPAHFVIHGSGQSSLRFDDDNDSEQAFYQSSKPIITTIKNIPSTISGSGAHFGLNSYSTSPPKYATLDDEVMGIGDLYAQGIKSPIGGSGSHISLASEQTEPLFRSGSDITWPSNPHNSNHVYMIRPRTEDHQFGPSTNVAKQNADLESRVLRTIEELRQLASQRQE